VDPGPENRSFYGFVFSGPFPGGVCARVLKDPARRGMILPRPRVHRTGSVYFHSKFHHDGAVRRGGPPKSPKPFSQLAVQFEFRSFPRFPKTQKAQQGLRTASWGVVFRDFGFNSKAAAPPASGFKRFPGGRPHRDPCSGLACQSSRSRYCAPGLERQNRMNGGDGMSADRVQRWV
jgi:hypothetical protein